MSDLFCSKAAVGGNYNLTRDTITRQNMANWMIRLSEEYLAVMYDYLHELLYKYHVIQADETPVLVNKDGRSAGSKSWMWVYRSGFMYPERQIILYEYQKTRNASHPRKFLKNYTGICVTDGYQVYHTLEKEKENLKIAGSPDRDSQRASQAICPVLNSEADTGHLQGRRKVDRPFFRRTVKAASIGGSTTGGCFLLVPETEQR